MIMKKLCFVIIVMFIAVGAVLAEDVNLAMAAYGGDCYMGDASKYFPVSDRTEYNGMWNMFTGTGHSPVHGMWGAGSSAVGEYSTIYRTWNQAITINKAVFWGGYRPGSTIFDGGLDHSEMYYRDLSTGNWVSFSNQTANNPHYDVWEPVGGVTTDAIRFEAGKGGSYSVVDDLQLWGPSITPAASPWVNIASPTNRGSNAIVTLTGLRYTSPGENTLFDNDKATREIFFNESYTNGAAWELDWGRAVEINSIFVEGVDNITSDPYTYCIADVELYYGDAWHNVNDGSTDFDTFRSEWENGTNSYIGTSLAFDDSLTASKIRITNFRGNYSAATGYNAIAEFTVMGGETPPSGTLIIIK